MRMVFYGLMIGFGSIGLFVKLSEIGGSLFNWFI